VTSRSDDVQLARRLAASAGSLLREMRDERLVQGRALGAIGDGVAHQWICRVLRQVRPRDGLLSEEGDTDAPDRLDCRRVWIVDPLDGTREFAEGRSDWAVHVALVVDGVPAASAVALPDLELVLCTAAPVAAPRAKDGPVRIAVSRTRPPAVAEHVRAALGAELVSMGSAGAKAMAVLRGEVDAYLHAGGQFEWDSAAPVGVATHAGLHASRIDGSPLAYNQPQPELPDLLVCRPELAADLLAAVGAAA
jgi:3'(2'), 5'-bisphosphate nucleotidase